VRRRETVDLPDGTRLYWNNVRYRPVAPEDRIYAKHKPDDPRAVRYLDNWYLPLEVLSEDRRTMPPTRSDTEAYVHRDKPRRCKCEVCKRPGVERWKARRDDQLRRGVPLDPAVSRL
jgi:hypothetical protein